LKALDVNDKIYYPAYNDLAYHEQMFIIFA
jgi:hypothetical protein